MIESTGVAAIGVHGRTKDERSGQPCHDDFIQAIVQVRPVDVYYCLNAVVRLVLCTS